LTEKTSHEAGSYSSACGRPHFRLQFPRVAVVHVNIIQPLDKQQL
jgi:hypothetical protein